MRISLRLFTFAFTFGIAAAVAGVTVTVTVTVHRVCAVRSVSASGVYARVFNQLSVQCRLAIKQAMAVAQNFIVDAGRWGANWKWK